MNKTIDPGKDSLDTDKTGKPITWNEWLQRSDLSDSRNIADFSLFYRYDLRE